MRTLGFVVSAALLLFLGCSSVQSFLVDWALVETAGQRVADLAELLAAATGIGAGVGAVLKRPWTGRSALVFAATLAFTAWAGPLARGESGIFRSLPDAGLAFLLGYVLYLGVRSAGKAEPDGGGSPS
jgi:hypothetical protein